MLQTFSDWCLAHGVDAISVIVAFIYARIQWNRGQQDTPFISKATGSDIFNNIALAPLALMFLAAFSDSVLSLLMHSSRVTLAASSVYALFCLLEYAPNSVMDVAGD